MKKIVLAVLVASAAMSAAHAENVVTGGYAGSKADGVSLSGLNLKYGYTPDESPVGAIGSLTITGRSDEYKDSGSKVTVDYGYGSLMGGVSYKINEYVKPYALVGVSRGAVKGKIKGAGVNYSEDRTDTGFAYGAGIQITPVAGFTIDAGYEGTNLLDSQVNTFVIGAGWRW